VAQLYWQFIGQDAWTVPMGEVRVRVALPGDVAPDQLRVWGHGPLTGTVYAQPDGTVLYSVAPLPAGQMLEARIVFPAATLATTPVIAETELPTILSDEGRWAADANAARAAARAAEHRKVVAGWTQIALDVLAVAALVWAYFRFGREHKVSLPGEYYRDIPADLHPALVDYLWKMGDLDANAVPATIVDLTRRGVVAVEPLTEDGGLFHKDERTYQLTLDTAKWESCDEIDKELLGLLFTTVAGGPTVTIPQIKDYAKHNQKTFREQHTAWRKLVVERGKALGFMEASGAAAARTFGLVGVGLLASVVVLGWGFHTPLAFVGIPVGIGVLVGATTLKRRTREAAELHAKYRGLRNYMRDFGRMQEKPPTAVVLWEQYLVLATVFGMADEVIAAMKVKVPEVMQDPAFSTTMWWVGAHEMGAQSFASAFSSGFAAATAASSPSGGGGGFSGGGGGGGGGVGGGAG
jgi:uncharacterized membrane protein